MDKSEFEQYMYEYPEAFEHNISRVMLCNILDYAEGMEENELYKYLCKMVPYVAERVIREVYY